MLTLFSYPLHPPGKPERARTEHLPRITVPTVFTHGTADPFGTIDELRPAAALIPAPTEIVEVTGARHDLGSKTLDVPVLAVDAALRLLAVTPSPPEPQRAGGTNGWAIAAFVVGILGGTILSVIFAIVALVQMKGRHQRGRGLAVAALVISPRGSRSITSVIAYGISTQGKTVQSTDLNTGDCIKDAYESELPTSVKRVRCDRPHYGEVFAVLTQPDAAPYPGDQPAIARGDECGPKFFDYAPNSPEGPVFRVAVAYPTAQAWANGDRSVVCVAMSTA